MADSQDGPPVLRPEPRRPFGLDASGPITSLPEDAPDPPPQRGPPNLNLESLNSRLNRVMNRQNAEPSPASATISRTQSIVNLTGSTLSGIYSAASGRPRAYNEQDDLTPVTPWGAGWTTGAQTPADRPNAGAGAGAGASEAQDATQNRRGHSRRRLSVRHPQRPLAPLSIPAQVFYFGWRALLLSALGILYGALVAKFQDGHKFSLPREDQTQAMAYEWKYMTFWAGLSVLLGVLLPWFDGVWDGAFGQEPEHSVGRDSAEDGAPEIDWALVFRGIGAFVGIVFAIRKVPWTSTLQVSSTLALANPVLWFLIDRSKPGFLLSAVVALGGSIMLMVLNPGMVPTPLGRSTPTAAAASNATGSAAPKGGGGQMLMLYGLARQETLETGMWVLSILFCCCVCFGNIGRRMTLNGSASAKGRWAERKP